MNIYDANNFQECKLCGFSIVHNKQGRFTSHLKYEHHLDLNEYLVKYFYTDKDLECSNPNCNKKVSLRRGKPNQYCSNVCIRKLSRQRKCEACGEEFEKEDLRVKTFGPECKTALKSKKVKAWHKQMDPEVKKTRFQNIIAKTAKTRRENNTPSWNSGKTGVYSTETIEKIRQAALLQFENGDFKKTTIEKIVEDLLIEMNIDFTYSFILEKRQYDFLLRSFNILIECDGDYWHANPKFYPKPEPWQIERQRIDEEKNRIASENKYTILRFWEDEILQNIDYVRQTIASYVALNHNGTGNSKREG